MLSIRLETHYEQEWLGEHPSLSPFLKGHTPLLHQWLTYNADSPLIINAYNTGTGKTKAALLRLRKRFQDQGGMLDSSEDNVLLIAPTNELLAQHARDVQEFCDTNSLPYRVLALSREALDRIKHTAGFSEGDLRRGYALHTILQNSRKVDSDRTKKATIFVVNPDIFYYAFYFRYHRYDRISLFQDIFTLCNYIVIDEFHYYSPKQLACFLFFMHLSGHYGQVHGSPKRQFCLLTATPDEKVDKYLRKLAFTIDRIVPEEEVSVEAGMMRKIPALAPIQLEVYSTDELKGREDDGVDGLLALVDRKRSDLAQHIRDKENGAIISSSLWCIEQIRKLLQPQLAEYIGCITGPTQSEERQTAVHKQLILATPTVDIGYNFDKGNDERQNIDFLFFDARSGDEFIQRLGRAGRVLGKQQTDRVSHVCAVVDPAFYKVLQEALQQSGDQILTRATLRKLAGEVLPKRNDLYAYMESGSIAEAFLPLYRLKIMESTEDEQQIRDLFESVRQLFNEQCTVKYEHLCGFIRTFIEQEKSYAKYEIFPKEKLELLERVIVRRESHHAAWLQSFADRLGGELQQRKKHNDSIPTPQERYAWILSDMRQYFVQKARFSFREYFQPPLALISDPRGLFTNSPVAVDDTLRIVRFYEATYFDSRQKWELAVQKVMPDWEKTVNATVLDKAKNAIVFCNLQELREPGAQLRIGLKLNVDDQLRVAWQERFTYQLTSLYGLQVVSLQNNHGLPFDIQYLLSERFIPALVVADKSRSAAAMWQLQKSAQYIPYRLSVTFADGEEVDHWAVLGTMALQIHAEIPPGVLKTDLYYLARQDDRPFII